MLAKLERIKNQIASIDSIDDAVDLRNRTKAIETYVRSQKNCKEIERRATTIRLRCERKLGELLSKQVKAGNPQLSTRTTIALKDLGVTRDQSSRFQTVAELPENDFEVYLEGRELSTNGIIKLVREKEREAERYGPPSGHRVLAGDMSRLWDDLEDDSVDLVLTDPPYAELSCYSDLAILAASKLKQGGLCFAYSGVFHLPEVLERMSDHLDYWWTIALPFTGSHTAIHPRRIQSSWKPILAFSKGKPDTVWATDLITGGGRKKDLHNWEQPREEAEYLIEKFSRPGDLVVDPFAGSGTTLAAAKKLGRNYLGCEVDSGTARMARRRLAA